MTTNEIIIILLLILIIIYLFKDNKNHKLKEMFDDTCKCSMDDNPVICDGRKYGNICKAMCVEKNINNCKKIYNLISTINSTEIGNNQNIEHQNNNSYNLDSTNNSIEMSNQINSTNNSIEMSNQINSTNNSIEMSNQINSTNNSIQPSPFKYSVKIQNILMEIENNQPTEQQINQLINVINEEVPNLMQFLEEIRNAPKDDKGQPNVDATKKGLFWIMFMLFNMSNGKYFSEIKSILIAANT
jgi:hypothetical protein